MIAVMEFVSGLLECERCVLLPTPEVGRGVTAFPELLLRLEEGFIGPIDPFHHVLDGLGIQFLPMCFTGTLLHFGEVGFQFIGREVLMVHLIAPFVKGDAVVIHLGNSNQDNQNRRTRCSLSSPGSNPRFSRSH